MYLPNRRLHRLKSYDYSQNGYYFITICTKYRRKILCDISGIGTIIVSDTGQSVLDAWEKMNHIDENIKTDCFCMMPNHIHGIIIIQNQPVHVPQDEHGKRRSIQDIVSGFKSATTRKFNESAGEQEKNHLWQSSFYDEVIRSTDMLYEVRKYIRENPKAWASDEYFL